MPSKRPRASFDPIPPDLDLNALVEATPNFQYADRISCDMIDQQGMEAFDRLVLLHVVIGGKPLVIDGYHTRCDPWTFSSKWLADNHGDTVEQAKNLADGEDIPLTIRHYLKNMGALTNQYFDNANPQAYLEKKRQRVYLKDIDCPSVWQDKLREHLPPNLFYLNDCTGEFGGPGAVGEDTSGGQKKGRGIAAAGDLISSLPPPMRADNLMCYIGHEGTYTPAHREMCASLGHNIMVETSDLVGDDGKPEKPGSSIWFMTETKDRQVVSEYWLSILGHDIEVEKHFAQIAAWKNAPFTTYIVEQRVGDFILIPPLAPHQVWNRGTRTMKVAWNRTTVETLEMALKEALPRAKLVCRDEQYKNKAIVFYTLQKYSDLIARIRHQQQTAASPQEAAALRSHPKIRQLLKDFKRLFNMYKDILLSEMFNPDAPPERNVQFLPFDSNVTCAYCRGNIFNRFLTCPSCDHALSTDEPEPYDVCMECYVMGRSCGCISKLKWGEQFKWKELVQKYENFRAQYIELEGGPKANSPLSIQEERQKLDKNTLAQICQDQLKKRPWFDIQKPTVEVESDNGEEITVNDDGTVKPAKGKKKKTEAYLKAHHACHVCCHRHPKWKMAECKCGRWWCYGSLFRAHDLMPQAVMEDPNWQCPHCKAICSAGNCRKDPRQKPYQPTGTLLGHDTRKVADARSVESLVDFSVSNLNWLGEGLEAPRKNRRLEQAQIEADQAKEADPTLSADHYAADEEDDVRNGIQYSPDHSVIDPQLDALDPALAALSGDTLAPPVRSQNQRAIARHASPRPEFVAPSAIMYQAPQEEENVDVDSDSVDFSADEEGLSVPRNNQRKRKSNGTHPNDNGPESTKKRARRSDADDKSVSVATKQYRKEQEKKALDEARASGRFIQVEAALKGKRKVVKLRLNPVNLARLVSTNHQGSAVRAPAAHPHAITRDEQMDSALLQSDIPQAPMPVEPTTAEAGVATTKVRVRVEHDEEFFTNKRHRKPEEVHIATNNKRRRQAVREYEEFDMASDPEQDNGEAPPDQAVKVVDGGGKRRRISQWQTRRQELNGQDEENDDEDDEPRPTVSGKGVASIRPATSPRTNKKAPAQLRSGPARSAATSARQAADHAAKLEAARLLDEDDDDQGEDEDALPVKSVAVSSELRSASSDSITVRGGRGGRKFRIVSGTSRRKTADNVTGIKAVAMRSPMAKSSPVIKAGVRV